MSLVPKSYPPGSSYCTVCAEIPNVKTPKSKARSSGHPGITSNQPTEHLGKDVPCFGPTHFLCSQNTLLQIPATSHLPGSHLGWDPISLWSRSLTFLLTQTPSLLLPQANSSSPRAFLLTGCGFHYLRCFQPHSPFLLPYSSHSSVYFGQTSSFHLILSPLSSLSPNSLLSAQTSEALWWQNWFFRASELFSNSKLYNILRLSLWYILHNEARTQPRSNWGWGEKKNFER